MHSKGVPNAPLNPSLPPALSVCVAEALAALCGVLDARLSGALGLKAGPEELAAMLCLEQPLTAGQICALYTKVRGAPEGPALVGPQHCPLPNVACLGTELISVSFLDEIALCTFMFYLLF